MAQVRINKYISDTGFCSRRDADKLIEDARVTVNGSLATPGTKVSEGDSVRIDGESLKANPSSFVEREKATKPSRRRVMRKSADNEEASSHISHKGGRGGMCKTSERSDRGVKRSSRVSHRKGNAPGTKSRY